MNANVDLQNKPSNTNPSSTTKPPVVAPSQVTCRLVDLLITRDSFGQFKYGTSLDRKDLTPQDWAKHAIEEFLDGAGYLTALIREIDAQDVEIAKLRKAAQEFALLRRGLDQLLHNAQRPQRYNHEANYQDGFKAFEKQLQNFLFQFDSAQILRQLQKE